MATATVTPRSSLKGRNTNVSVPKGRPRKTLQSVDTNISSYDRTDPFFAFNVLRKFLGSLPSRIGGCQYKLTPEEHKLSLHLLTIVEPFVGLSPSRRTLTQQPTEILDSLVFHVDDKRDLLSLALSCHRLHGVIFPRHYDYRVIRCKVSSISVWNHLIVNRSLARNVRRLEILDERSTEPASVPSDILVSDTDLESTDDELGMHVKQERFLVSALTKMTALHSFSWSCNHSPISIDNVWPTLLKCPSIREVEINDNLVFSDYSHGGHGTTRPRNSQKSILPELKTVALRSTKHVYGSTKTPQLLRISNLLTNCPNLESLDIGYEHRRGSGYQRPVADDFFLCSRWSALRSLSLSNLFCSPIHGFDAAATFLASHVNLEVLHLDFGDGIVVNNNSAMSHGSHQLVLPHNSLPHLRELRCSRDVATAVLQCPCDVHRPLESIKSVKLSGSGGDQPFLTSLKLSGGTVKRFELAGWNDIEDIRRLVECVPKLTWLDVGKKGNPQQQREHSNSKTSSTYTVATNVVEWAAVLAPLMELSAFHGVKFFYEVSSLTLSTLSSSSPSSLSASELSRVRKNEKIATVLANKCLRLRRVDHWEETAGPAARVIVLNRDGGDVKWDVRRVKT